jgi:nitronate monooxygenase
VGHTSDRATRGRLGIALPVVQAPMAGVQDSRLAIAVSNAGGLGSIPGAMLGPEALRADLAALGAGTTQAYNVNFFCHSSPAPDAARERAWRSALAPYFAELGLDPDAAPTGPVRAPFSHDAADVLAEFRPAVVSFHFGLPEPGLLARVRSWGSAIWSSATTVDEARWLEAHGADVIIAQGLEAGGHRGHFLSDDLDRQMGTLALVPQVVHAVDLPVVAAGGIADAAGVTAALALGAAAVQVGTAYLLCPEATTSAVHRAALTGDGAPTTALTNLISGRPARGIVNRIMRELGPMSPLPPAFPLAAGATGPLRSAAERLGRGDFSPLWAGQNVTGCRVAPAAEVTRALGDTRVGRG